MIIDVFRDTRIGMVYYIDKHRKVNDRQKVYHFAFINIELYKTPQARSFMNNMTKYGSVRLNYTSNSELYWEVKPYVEREIRKGELTLKDREDMAQEFEDLSREIHNTILDAQSYNMWTPSSYQYLHNNSLWL
jgi:hypothetical protein